MLIIWYLRFCEIYAGSKCFSEIVIFESVQSIIDAKDKSSKLINNYQKSFIEIK